MSRADGRPNILFIMTDQQRFDYVGYAGASFLRTPSMDRLAARGVRFTECASNAPVCVPARVALATGLYPWRLGSIGNESYLPASTRTCYQRFRDADYRVGCVGKLDLAKPDPYNGRFGDRPCVFTWGFTHPEETEGKMHAGRYPTPQGPYGFYLAERGLYDAFHADYEQRRRTGWIKDAAHDSVLPAEHFEDVYIGRRAAEWINRVPDDFPWFYLVSFVGPHGPFDPPTEYADRCRDAAVPEPIDDDLTGKPAWVRSRALDLSREEVTHTRRQYAAYIELIDEQVGGILDALDRRGVTGDTFIVLTSDHGEMLGDHGLYSKSLPYEPALRVPLAVAGPGIDGGRVSDALVEQVDLSPTVCELAGLPAQENIDGRSFGAILRDEADEHRQDQLAILRNFTCLRTRTHTYIQSENDIHELYDLMDDPGEKHNIAPERPDMVRDLAERARARLLAGAWRR